MICQVRDHNECGCSPDRCAVQPPKAQQAPILIATWKMQLATMTAGLVVSLCVLAAMSAWNEQLRTENLRNQEVNAYVYRR